MKIDNLLILLILMYGAIFLAGSPTEKVLTCRGTSDASAAVAISENLFIVADDENNILRVYDANIGGLPVYSYDLTDFLGVEPEHPEADIEGATLAADRIYWITSHGRNKDGKIRPNRYRFFATTFKVKDGNVIIMPVGKPCSTLVHQLIRAEHIRHLKLDKTIRFDEILTKKERKKLAPKEKGLNIEGLCASADGKTLYIGFRNLLARDGGTHQQNALVVPLKNAAVVIEKGDAPIFGEPMLWNLGFLGIRAMEYSPYHRTYFIIAGPCGEEQKFTLYKWFGDEDAQPILLRKLGFEKNKFTPEALIPFKNSAGLLLLSDDGTLVINVSSSRECMDGQFSEDGTCLNKYLLDPNKKTFRSIRIEP